MVQNELLSFGGGGNSVAMSIVLVEQGWRGPIVFADTGGGAGRASSNWT